MPQLLERPRLGAPALVLAAVCLHVGVIGCSRDTGDRMAASPSPHAEPIEPHAEQVAPQAEPIEPQAIQVESPASDLAMAPSVMERSEPATVAARQAVPRSMARVPSIGPRRRDRCSRQSRCRNVPRRALALDDLPAMAAIEELLAPTEVSAMAEPIEHRSPLPAGATRQSENGFATVQVFFATDRQRSVVPMSAYDVSGHKHAFVALGSLAVLMIVFAALSALRGRWRIGILGTVAGGVSACLAAAIVMTGQAGIEKHGVTYTADRGELTRGVCEVTVPDSHHRGLVERPSLLRFEIHEDQRKHIVLTRAVELGANDFDKRLVETVATSPDRDLLVFIHGYNVDFDSAVRRTAQIAVDLPFEGVPVCYSWPSQGSLIGYSIDANNAEWTVPHLKAFLLELAEESGADSINVIAHSMGNRAMTAAMQQISWEAGDETAPNFDRIVLAGSRTLTRTDFVAISLPHWFASRSTSRCTRLPTIRRWSPASRCTATLVPARAARTSWWSRGSTRSMSAASI